MIKSAMVLGVLVLGGCVAERTRCEEVVVATMAAPGVQGLEAVAMPAQRGTITVQGDAEVLTAPDRFVITVGFEVQATTLARARDDSRGRAAALLAVALDHGVGERDLQSEQLSLQPRYENYDHAGGQQLIGYRASRGLTVTLHDIDEVEGLLYDMLAAGANRVDRVQFESSARSEKRSEARVLAVRAARMKAEAMAAELGQTIGEPVRIEEQTPPAWGPAPMSNMMLNNETLAQVSETVAGGKLRVHAGVSVVFTLRPA
jgi:uncharacterized protein YggE